MLAIAPDLPEAQENSHLLHLIKPDNKGAISYVSVPGLSQQGSKPERSFHTIMLKENGTKAKTPTTNTDP